MANTKHIEGERLLAECPNCANPPHEGDCKRSPGPRLELTRAERNALGDEATKAARNKRAAPEVKCKSFHGAQVEFRDGRAVCPDCDTPLVWVKASQLQSAMRPDPRLAELLAAALEGANWVEIATDSEEWPSATLADMNACIVRLRAAVADFGEGK